MHVIDIFMFISSACVSQLSKTRGLTNFIISSVLTSVSLLLL